MAPSFLKKKALELSRLPLLVNGILKQPKAIEKITKEYAKHFNFLYIGLRIQYPIALEGVLKLKEISITRRRISGGEMVHSPIALIDPQAPVVILSFYCSMEKVKTPKPSFV